MSDQLQRICKAQRESLALSLELSKRGVEIGELVAQDRALKLYPNAIQVSQPLNYSTLIANDNQIQNQSDEYSNGLLVQNFMSIGSSLQTAEKLTSNFTTDEILFLNSSFNDLKNDLRRQFTSGLLHPDSLVAYLKKYVYDKTSIPSISLTNSSNSYIPPLDSTIGPPTWKSVIPDEEEEESDTDIISPIIKKSEETSYYFEKTPEQFKKLTKMQKMSYLDSIGVSHAFVLGKKSIGHRKEDIDTFYNNEMINRRGSGFKPKIRRKVFKGSGYSGEENVLGELKDHFVNGLYFLDKEHFKNAIVSIRYKSTRKTKVPNFSISPEVKDVITGITKGEGFDYMKYHKLVSNDKKHTRRFIKYMKIDNIDIEDNDISKLYEDFEIAKGELNSGNNSPLIKKTLIKLAGELYCIRRIPRNQLDLIIQQYKE